MVRESRLCGTSGSKDNNHFPPSSREKPSIRAVMDATDPVAFLPFQIDQRARYYSSFPVCNAAVVSKITIRTCHIDDAATMETAICKAIIVTVVDLDSLPSEIENPTLIDTFLSQSERERAATIVNPSDRARYRSAHIAVRARLSASVNILPAFAIQGQSRRISAVARESPRSTRGKRFMFSTLRTLGINQFRRPVAARDRPTRLIPGRS